MQMQTCATIPNRCLNVTLLPQTDAVHNSLFYFSKQRLHNERKRHIWQQEIIDFMNKSFEVEVFHKN